MVQVDGIANVGASTDSADEHPSTEPGTQHLEGSQIGVMYLVTVANRALAVRCPKVSPTAAGQCLPPFFFNAASEEDGRLSKLQVPTQTA